MTAITKLQVSPVFFLWLGGITHMPLQTAQACVYFGQTPVLGLGLGVDFTFPPRNKTTSTL